MSEARLFNTLLAPHMSEKAIRLDSTTRQYAFKVASTATKLQIKNAVEMIFKVTVRSVRTVNVKSKNIRFGGKPGKRSAWKKAYVTLSGDQELDFTGVKS